MIMKKISIALALILVFIIAIGWFFRNKNQTLFLSNEEITNIYHENRELINSIKDGLFSSGFIPHDGITTSGYDSNMENSILLFYDYENEQLFCENDPMDEKLQKIKNVHSDAIDYFIRVNEDFNPSIQFRKIRDMDIVIEFGFLDKKSWTHAGIIYTAVPEEVGGKIHLEDNWYAYRYMLD